jgi:hypothetical protein
VKLTEVEILTVPCEVHVSTGGTFEVFLRGHAEDEDARALANSGTFSEAIERAKPQVRQRKVKTNVPFYRLTDRFTSFERGTATGFHAGTGNVLAVFDGDTEQLPSSGYRASAVYRGDMTEEARGELVQLRREISELSNRQRALEEEWTFDLAVAVREAIEASA